MGWLVAAVILAAMWLIVKLYDRWTEAQDREAEAWDVVDAFVRDLEASEREAAAFARLAKFNAHLAARRIADLEAARLDSRKTAARLLWRAAAAEAEREEYRQLLDLSDAERKAEAETWARWRVEFIAAQVKNERRAAVGDKLAELLRSEGYAVAKAEARA